MNVFWTEEALEDRYAIWDFLAAVSRSSANKMDLLFSAAAARLEAHPLLGYPGIIPGTRELFPHASYRLIYEIDGEEAWILALVHTSRM